MRKAPSYFGLRPASERASRAAKGASRKRGTTPEVLLRKELWQAGLRYRKNVASLPGKPDIVFLGPRVVVFCDGDFWHGKDWAARRKKLRKGHNGDYWIAKIERNMARDREHTATLEREGWKVIRVWEADIKRDPEKVARSIAQVVGTRGR